ncbi:MAG: hypothetical protein RL125_689, partial [Actinomycetota bacterium]
SSVPSGPTYEKKRGKTVAKEAKDPVDKSKPSAERQKALDTALAQIERQFGKGSVIKMSATAQQLLSK